MGRLVLSKISFDADREKAQTRAFFVCALFLDTSTDPNLVNFIEE